MSNFPINWTDKQWFAFICGFRAALTVKDANAPFYRLDTVLQPIGIGGPNERAICIADTQYDGDGTYSIPVYTFNMTFDPPMNRFTGFTARIDLSDPRLTFSGVTAGSFDPAVNLTTQLLPGNILLVQGLIAADYIDRDTGASEPYSLADLREYGPVLYQTAKSPPFGSSADMEVLFYLNVAVMGGVTQTTPIHLNLLYRNGTIDSDSTADTYTTLITFLQGSDISGVAVNPLWHYMFFVTPILAVSGAILSDLPDNTAPISPSAPIQAQASPSCVYASTVLTPPHFPAVMGLYVNPNREDLQGGDITKVSAVFHVDNAGLYPITRWTIEAGRGWELVQALTSIPDENGQFDVYITAERIPDAPVFTGMFAYIIATIIFEDAVYIPVTPTAGTIYYD